MYEEFITNKSYFCEKNELVSDSQGNFGQVPFTEGSSSSAVDS